MRERERERESALELLEMWATAVRLFARTNPNPNFRSRSSLGRKKAIDPKVPTEEAFRLAGILHNVLHNNGPLTVAACWSHAQVSNSEYLCLMLLILSRI